MKMAPAILMRAAFAQSALAGGSAPSKARALGLACYDAAHSLKWEKPVTVENDAS